MDVHLPSSPQICVQPISTVWISGGLSHGSAAFGRLSSVDPGLSDSVFASGFIRAINMDRSQSQLATKILTSEVRRVGWSYATCHKSSTKTTRSGAMFIHVSYVSSPLGICQSTNQQVSKKPQRGTVRFEPTSLKVGRIHSRRCGDMEQRRQGRWKSCSLVVHLGSTVDQQWIIWWPKIVHESRWIKVSRLKMLNMVSKVWTMIGVDFGIAALAMVGLQLWLAFLEELQTQCHSSMLVLMPADRFLMLELTSFTTSFMRHMSWPASPGLAESGEATKTSGH